LCAGLAALSACDEEPAPAAPDTVIDMMEEVAAPEVEVNPCGNGVCSKAEDSRTCPEDCGPLCGDGACNGGETTWRCWEDCGSLCGDNFCTGAEDHCTCPQDCGANTCGDGVCWSIRLSRSKRQRSWVNAWAAPGSCPS